MSTGVRFQPTPNPNAGKFVAGRTVVEGKGSKSFYSAAQAVSDPLAAALFAIDGVTSLFMADDFITVTKAAAADWSSLTPRVIRVIEERLG